MNIPVAARGSIFDFGFLVYNSVSKSFCKPNSPLEDEIVGPNIF
jgi:hypothetical protein